MQLDALKELGLSPVWVRRSIAEMAPVPAPAVGAHAVPAVDAAGAAAVAAPVAAPVAVNVPVEKMSWQQLIAVAESCRLCPLCEGRYKVAFGCGDTQARVMFVGEGPGLEEDRRGEPFVGAAGKLLDLMLHAVGLSRNHDVYIANVVKCRPPNNRTPEVTEAQACMPYLRRQIALVQPQVLVALGKVAATHLLQTETGVGQLRQKMHRYEEVPVVVTYHPAYLLRQPKEKAKAWEDLIFLKGVLGEDAQA